MTVRIINSDVMDGLRSLPDESVQCVVTSPPYWGLRDYGVAGQIGLEPTFPEFIERLVAVFAEVRRALRPDGVCFVNMGDAYAGGGGFTPGSPSNETSKSGRYAKAGATLKSPGRMAGFKSKDLIGQPWRLAFALQESGWWLRGDYIWHKPNPMPESVTDRCTKAHEYVFHLTKSERYYWDKDGIAEEMLASSVERQARPWNGNRTRGMPDTASPHSMSHYGKDSDGSRNKRSVWTIATSPFPEAHFATFPPELPEICIKAGSKPGDTILDPFSGAGTTALVADRLQRHAIGIELNPEYVAISQRRINGDRGGLLDIMEAAE